MTEQDKSTETLTFRFIKDNRFRVAHASGFIGNITPQNDIFVSFYNERYALPDRFTFALNDDGNLGELLDGDISEDVIRDLDFGVLMNSNTAKNLILWLTEMVRQADDDATDETEAVENLAS